MFTIYDPRQQRWPIKVWLEHIGQLEAECLQQALNLANLPFIHQWVALMPDTHSGYGMPIGGVIAAEEVIIPNAVGVDIGCGMIFVQTDIPVKVLTTIDTPDGKLAQAMVSKILRKVPTGFDHHQAKQPCRTVDDFRRSLTKSDRTRLAPELMKELDPAYYQLGTLGSGNHFIELQADDSGYLGIMVHSGSRNFGYKICHHFNQAARKINKDMNAPVPPQWDLAYLPLDSLPGQEYIRWMKLALDFAYENRVRMMETAIREVCSLAEKYAGLEQIRVSEPINCHHNYAALEDHYGKKVWVHRKGAIRAGEGQMGIIPGAMGTYSYLVRGKGNPESFCSCSHGAGRRMSRKAAKKQYSVKATMDDLKALGVYLGKEKHHDISEETRFAYKEIDFVIKNELDLIEVTKRLRTIAVIKG